MTARASVPARLKARASAPDAAGALNPDLLHRIRGIWERSRAAATRSVNTAHVCANWLIGQQIVLAEQGGERRAEYGRAMLENLAARLTSEYGAGFSLTALKHMRSFYLGYPDLLEKGHALRDELVPSPTDAPRGRRRAANTVDKRVGKGHAVRDQSDATTVEWQAAAEWRPGVLHSGLSWTHYRGLLKLRRRDARDFYEIEALKGAWSARQLERQIDSLLFERLAKSRDKPGVLALANEGHQPERPVDLIKDPYVLEFLALPDVPRLHESQLEEALISQLQTFLLELGNGFAFVGRQRRLTLDGDHFYPDLVFYQVKLKCYVIVDLKVGKLDHADLGQMQLYVNWYDREVLVEGDNPTIGLILCTEKNDAVVRYVLAEQNQQIFASRYQLFLPTEAQLKAELRRELRRVDPSTKRRRTANREQG